MSFDEIMRKAVAEEIEKQQQKTERLPIPIAKFCRDTNISRATMWRREKDGTAKLIRIGRKVFIDPQQFT